MYNLKTVKDIKPAIEFFLSPHLSGKSLEIAISDPWYPYPKYDGKNDSLAMLGGKAGIYLFSKPNEPWSVRLEENNSDIWYIGKSVNNNTTQKEIRGRLWEHLNPVKGNKRTLIENNISTKAIFTAKDWDSRTYVPQQIRDAIVLGKFVAYSIRIDSIADQPNLVINLESFLIKSYRLANGERPIFNLRS